MPKKVCVVIFAILACAQVGGARWGKAQGPPKPADAQPSVVKMPEVDKGLIKSRAEELSRAFIAGEFLKVAELTYPDVVEMGGGREKMAAYLAKEMGDAKTMGYEILSYALGEVGQVVGVKEYLFAAVPTTMRMKTPQGVWSRKSFLLAVSRDGAKTWTFVDGEGTSKERFQVLCPSAASAADKLELPTPGAPTMEKEGPGPAPKP